MWSGGRAGRSACVRRRTGTPQGALETALATIDEILAVEPPAFARAVRAIVSGNADALRAELAAAPDLVRARSASVHRATLLHDVAANGIETELQFAVPTADEIAAVLFAAGAEADATLRDARHRSTPAVWTQHARGPRRALAREVAALLQRHAARSG